jgi:hypothetical protein
MFFISYTALFIAICCAKNEDLEERRVYKRINKDTLNLNINEDSNTITITFKTKDYLPISGVWFSENTKIYANTFFIDGNNLIYWIIANITTKDSLDNLVNTLEEHVFEFKIDKNKFIKYKNELGCTLEVLKKDDFYFIMTDYIKNFASKNLAARIANIEKYFELLGKFDARKINFIVRYFNYLNEMPSNLNDYELWFYKPIEIKECFQVLGLIKKSMIDALFHIFLTVSFWGFLIFVVRFSMSKYF